MFEEIFRNFTRSRSLIKELDSNLHDKTSSWESSEIIRSLDVFSIIFGDFKNIKNWFRKL